jgi:TPR repeat protein
MKLAMKLAMKPAMRHAGRSLLALPLLAALCAPSQAAAPAPAARGSVLVTGSRAVAGQRLVDPATDRILSGRSASSCAFMGPYNAAFDPVMVDYMDEFAPPGSLSNDVVAVTEYAPTGDASNMRDFSRRAYRGTAVPGGGAGFRSGCNASDLRFAAGRLHIRRNDKSLRLAFEAFGARDYPGALALFNTAWTKVGYQSAALMLAQMHLYGLGTPKDGKQAVYWLDQVANGRFDPSTDRMRFDRARPQAMSEQVQAAFMLARMYERGVGVPADPDKARKWYRKAAEFGYVPALDILGRAWIGGTLGARDADKGLDYLKEAAKAGYVPAQYRLGKLYYGGLAGVPADVKLAGAWFEAAARNGHPGALFAAGRMYDLGEGVPADQSKAVVYYKEAALKGDRDAEFALGTYFYEGGLVPKDARTARGWFDAAARQGQPDAMFNLGAMLFHGEGGPPDIAMAYVWLSLATRAGHDGAGAALAVVAPRLTAQDQARAKAVLDPKS